LIKKTTFNKIPESGVKIKLLAAKLAQNSKQRMAHSTQKTRFGGYAWANPKNVD
jgi:hypothetical protein